MKYTTFSPSKTFPFLYLFLSNVTFLDARTKTHLQFMCVRVCSNVCLCLAAGVLCVQNSPQMSNLASRDQRITSSLPDYITNPCIQTQNTHKPLLRQQHFVFVRVEAQKAISSQSVLPNVSSALPTFAYSIPTLWVLFGHPFPNLDMANRAHTCMLTPAGWFQQCQSPHAYLDLIKSWPP